MAHDAFISYAFEDKAIADALCERLEAAGVACWLAPRDPRPGIPYGAQIVQAIAQSRVAVLVLSSHANASRAVLGEVEVGANRGKTIVPFRVEDVQPVEALEYYIRALHWFDATRAPIEDRLAEGVRFVQDLLHGLSPTAPPIRHAKNNLPAQVTSFVGRETEVAEIGALLDAHRLVTLTGSAGVGKTRASLEVATLRSDRCRDGVWFIELAPLASGEHIASTVALGLGVALTPDGDPLEHLVAALRTRSVLIVLDNCEHLVEPLAYAVATILRHAPQVQFLASSRQALGIAGEWVYRLPSLGVPGRESSSLRLEDARQYAAISLFAERAIAADRHFALTDENAPFVGEICRRLDGIPLAIELAAARVKTLSPQQLRDRLDERFRVLTGGSRDALPRQQTLRALIDWSYDLLDERERALFRRLGIFVNGFALEGAVAVGSGEGLDELDLLDVLTSLVDKSLVLVESEGDALRYRLLESTRVYAREKLVAAGESNSSARRHMIYVHDRFLALEPSGDSRLQDALALDLEDVRAALDWAQCHQEGVLGGELLAKIWATWGMLGLYAEGLARVETFIALLDAADAQLLARLWTVVTVLALNSGHTARGFEAAAEAVAWGRRCGDGPSLAEALGRYAYAAARLHRLGEAATALAEADEIPGVPGAVRRRLLEARALFSNQSGDLASAARAFDELRNEHRSLGNAAAERVMAVNLAEVEHKRGDTQRAIAILCDELPWLRAQDDRSMLAQALGNLAGYYAAEGDHRAACAVAREAIGESAGGEPDAVYVAIAIEHLALALALAGETSRPAILAGYADAAYQEHGYEREYTESLTRERLGRVFSEHLSPGQLEASFVQGAGMATAAAIAEALR